MIIIGLGTGRSGTASLAALLNLQSDAICFHEMAPSVVRFAGTPRPIINGINEFQAILDGGDPSLLTADLSRGSSITSYEKLCKMPRVRLIGDIAFYYLSYVEQIAKHNSNVRFVCLKRDKEQTVNSWMQKSSLQMWRSKRIAARISSWITREPYLDSRNFWMEHDGTKWMKDEVWDKCFPKFKAEFKINAIRQYWDFYYQRADQLEAKLKNVFRIIDVSSFNDRSYQSSFLEFCGIEKSDQVLSEVHIHKQSRGD